MVNSPLGVDTTALPSQDNWGQPAENQPLEPMSANGDTSSVSLPMDSAHLQGGGAPASGMDAMVTDGGDSHSKQEHGYREKQPKPNKVYVGGLPEHTRPEDLQSCFGKIGNIVNIELKVGYGFVEFDSREAAEESVAKYHEGYFMGNKIRVEMSRGGTRNKHMNGDPGACFKCGQVGHWARECPNMPANSGPHGHRRHSEAPLLDRLQTSRDYPAPPVPPREYPPFRDDYGPPGRYPPARDPRYSGGYDYPPPPSGRDYRRPPSPPRDYRDYPSGPPPVRPPRDYDDYSRVRGPPPPPVDSRYDRPGYPVDGPPGYPPRGYPGPPRDPYDRYDRRPPPNAGPYAPRPRTPPGIPPRGRDDGPPRDYPPVADYRGRPPSPGRYNDYRNGAGPASPSYRRRSRSPPRATGAPYDPAAYSGPREGFAGNGYPGGPSGPPPPAAARGGPGYVPRPGRDGPEPPVPPYRRA